MKQVTSGGGWPAILYALKKAREMGGWWRAWKALRSRNACKTCALGMGGQRGGLVNERGHFPEVCKKSLQAMAADMQGAIRDEFWTSYSIPQLQRFSPAELERCGRLVQPMIRSVGHDYFRPLSWDEALDRIADKLRSVSSDETFWYFSGRSSNEAGFLLQLLARMYGTNNVNNCSYYCHQASGVGLQSSIGSGTSTIELEDLDAADLIFVIGGNPASNHPRLMTTLMHVRRRGGEVIVINPIRETGLVRFRVPSDVRSLLFGTDIASLYIQPHIGGDLALLQGIAKRIVERNAHDPDYLANYCVGHEPWLSHLRSLDWHEIEARSGVATSDIDAIATRYAAAKNAVFTWTMGITHHTHGVQNVQEIANLALLRGMVGRTGAGLLPIRGHSNVQGIGTVGVTPQLKQAVFDRLQSEFGIQLPTATGLDTLGCIEQAQAGQLKFGLCLGGNLYGSNPDSAYAASALSRLEMVVYLSTTLNTGHAHGLGQDTIILPVLARDEEPEPTTQESMFNYVRLSDGGPARHVGPRSEVSVISSLAERVFRGHPRHPIDWGLMRHTGAIRTAIARVVPGLEPLATIDETKQEFHIGGRILRRPVFATPDGKARLHVHPLPELPGGGSKLRLMTIRSEGQFNTVVYEEEDLYRGQDRRDVILLHPEDLAELGLVPDQPVTVRSEIGRLTGIVARSFPPLKKGNAAMYYPEANVLVPRQADTQSRTPAFKSIVVTVEAAT